MSASDGRCLLEPISVVITKHNGIERMTPANLSWLFANNYLSAVQSIFTISEAY